LTPPPPTFAFVMMDIDAENVAPVAIASKKATKATKKGGKTIEEMYQKKTQLEHIL
jgi:hypothetical protein